MPGDNVEAKLKLNFPLPVEKGLRFALREGGKTIAAGVVSEVLADEPGDELIKGKAKKKKWSLYLFIHLSINCFI